VPGAPERSERASPTWSGAALAWSFVRTLDELRADALTCTSCKLATAGRTQVVFGVGDPGADLVFVGEGPGAEEDRLGEPFVGRSGKLLDKLLIEEIGLTRDRCYIANVVKCRPPGNRDPEPDEVATCRPWLERQLELIDPTVVVTLGKFAAQLLLDEKQAISRLRGRLHPFRGGVLIPTWHPAYALRGGAGPLAEMRADFVRAKLALEGGEREIAAS
jgi:uracil-DNA glycosylase